MTTEYHYDFENDTEPTFAGDLLSVSYSDNTPSHSFSYDRLGRTRSVTDASGTRRYDYSDSALDNITYETGQFEGWSIDYRRDERRRSGGFDLKKLGQGTLHHNDYS